MWVFLLISRWFCGAECATSSTFPESHRKISSTAYKLSGANTSVCTLASGVCTVRNRISTDYCKIWGGVSAVHNAIMICILQCVKLKLSCICKAEVASMCSIFCCPEYYSWQNIKHTRAMVYDKRWTSLSTPSFLWFCSAGNESPTGLRTAINTSLPQTSTGLSATLRVCTPRWGMQHQFREFCSHRGILLPLTLHSTVTPHCTLLCCNLSFRAIFSNTMICITVFSLAEISLCLFHSSPQLFGPSLTFVLVLDLSYFCT